MVTTAAPDILSAALKRCETEPIHQIGHVQPHGALIAVGHDPERTVRHVSANISRFFDTTPEAILGQPFHQLVGTDQAAQMEGIMSCGQKGPRSSQLLYAVANNEIVEMRATIQSLDSLDLIEVEVTQTRIESVRIGELFNQVRQGLWALDEAGGFAAYCSAAVDFVRNMLGFDRVMMYRFDANWDGEVIAESRRETASSYLGNRFPAGDIPPQARALYARNPLRFICDIDAEPVPVLPVPTPGKDEPLDLSCSMLRAFSSVHVEYLRNMGVRASASISIFVQGRLWGLIACHHHQPAIISHPVREMLEFVGKVISMKLAGLEAERRIAQGDRLGKTLISVIRHLFVTHLAIPTLRQHEAEILQLVDATGAVLVIKGERLSLGKVPGDEDIDGLLAWLRNETDSEYFESDHLSSRWPAASRFADVAAGCLATPVTSEMQTALLFFRPEKVRTIEWAGNPEKLLTTDAQGGWRISPRTSFSAWRETWRYRSEPWLRDEITSAVVLAEVLLDVLDMPARPRDKTLPT